MERRRRRRAPGERSRRRILGQAARLAFKLSTILAGTNIVAVLHDDDTATDHARRAITRLLGGGPSVANWT